MPTETSGRRMSRQLEALRNYLLKRMVADLGLELDQVLSLTRSAVAVDGELARLVKVRRLEGGAAERHEVALDADCSQALRLYVRETGLVDRSQKIFISLRGNLTEKSARRLVRKGPHMTAAEVREWWRQGI